MAADLNMQSLLEGVNLETLLHDVEHIDVDAVYAALPTKEQLEAALAQEKLRRTCCDFCDKAKAIMANNGNGLTITEIVAAVNELHTVYQAAGLPGCQ